MGGDDSQKLLPWRGAYSPPGRRPPVHCKLNTLTQCNAFCGETYFPEKYPSVSIPPQKPTASMVVASVATRKRD